MYLMISYLLPPVVQTAIRDGSAEISGSFTAEESMRKLQRLSRVVTFLPILKNFRREHLARHLVRYYQSKSYCWSFRTWNRSCYMIITYGLLGVVADLALVYKFTFTSWCNEWRKLYPNIARYRRYHSDYRYNVDGNIIVLERIKEEMRMGKTPLNAIAGGYGKSFSTIFDANVTTILAGVVLYYLGTGNNSRICYYAYHWYSW